MALWEVQLLCNRGEYLLSFLSISEIVDNQLNFLYHKFGREIKEEETKVSSFNFFSSDRFPQRTFRRCFSLLW